MMVFAPLVLGAQLLLVADGPPTLNIEPGCQAAQRSGIDGRSADVCMNSENEARKMLGDKWSQFNASQQARCSNLVKMGGPPSYIELLTCLEMAEQADKIPDGNVMRNGRSLSVGTR